MSLRNIPVPSTLSLIGGLLGGGAGAVTALVDNEFKNEEDKKKRLRRYLVNTLTGAGLGFAGGYGLEAGLTRLSRSQINRALQGHVEEHKSDTLRNVVAPYYQNIEGGVDRVIQNAQAAAKKDPIKELLPLNYRAMSRRRIPYTLIKPNVQLSASNTGEAAAFYAPIADLAVVPNLKDRELFRGLLGHELLHGMQFAGPRRIIENMRRMSKALSRPRNLFREVDELKHRMPHGDFNVMDESGEVVDTLSGNGISNLLNWINISEIDTISAEIKRRYARDFGKEIRTPEDADQAIKDIFNKSGLSEINVNRKRIDRNEWFSGGDYVNDYALQLSKSREDPLLMNFVALWNSSPVMRSLIRRRLPQLVRNTQQQTTMVG